MKRARHFRVMLIELSCGHVVRETTSFYRLPASTASAILGTLIRRGVWCFKCDCKCQPTKYLGTSK